MRHGKEVRLAALTIGTALVFWACDDGSDLVAPPAPAPTLRPADYGARTFRKPHDLFALGRSLPIDRDLVVSRSIPPGGGTIVLREAGLSLRFPAGAVASRTSVTVRAHAGDRVAYTFEPHGLQFAVPVEVAQLLIFASGYSEDDVMRDLQGAYLPHGIADLDASGVAAVNEAYPVRVRSFESYNERFVPALATFQIGHFSGYMLASSAYMLGSSGYMLASGRKDSTATPPKAP
jgi:hypothetical protein